MGQRTSFINSSYGSLPVSKCNTHKPRRGENKGSKIEKEAVREREGVRRREREGESERKRERERTKNHAVSYRPSGKVSAL